MYGCDNGDGGLFDLLRKNEKVKFETAKQEVIETIKKNYTFQLAQSEVNGEG